MADCKALASTLRRDLIRPLVLFNFGEDKRIPYIRFDCEESEDLEQMANILGTLIQQTGLRVPTSYLYKKFSIPEPEAAEEIAQPRANAGAGTLPFKQPPDRAQLALKDRPVPGTQQSVDQLADAALKRGAGSFQKAFAPVLKLIKNAESLEALKAAMEDDGAVEKLYRAMDVSGVEDLLQKVMLYADLEGRVSGNG